MNTEVNNILHILVRDEKVWLSMAEEISKNSKIPSKDLLHDFYIALHSKIDSGKVKIKDILYNDSLNKAFIYKMMRNIFIDTIKNMDPSQSRPRIVEQSSRRRESSSSD